jgi:hypothetical protein
MTKKKMFKKTDAGLPAKIVNYFFPMKPEAQPIPCGLLILTLGSLKKGTRYYE